MGTRVIAFDPGGTTGVTVWNSTTVTAGTFEYERAFQMHHIGPELHHGTLWKFLTSENPDTVVCESFEYRREQRDNVVLISLEYIGIIKLYCELTRTPCHMQTAAQGKGFWSDDKIKKLGLWKPSMKHAMDATRHLLYWLTLSKDGPKQTQLLMPLREETP